MVRLWLHDENWTTVDGWDRDDCPGHAHDWQVWQVLEPANPGLTVGNYRPPEAVPTPGAAALVSLALLLALARRARR